MKIHSQKKSPDNRCRTAREKPIRQETSNIRLEYNRELRYHSIIINSFLQLHRHGIVTDGWFSIDEKIRLSNLRSASWHTTITSLTDHLVLDKGIETTYLCHQRREERKRKHLFGDNKVGHSSCEEINKWDTRETAIVSDDTMWCRERVGDYSEWIKSSLIEGIWDH